MPVVTSYVCDNSKPVNDACFRIRYWVNGNLFNLWLEAKLKIQTDVLDGLLYVDCVAMIEDARDYGSTFTSPWQLWSHNSLQPAPGKPKMEPIITVTRQRLQVVDKSRIFFRLSVYISAIDDEVTARIAKDSVKVCLAVYTVHTFLTRQAWHNWTLTCCLQRHHSNDKILPGPARSQLKYSIFTLFCSDNLLRKFKSSIAYEFYT